MDELVLAREAQPAGERLEARHVFGRVQVGGARPAGHAVPGARVRAQCGQRVAVEGCPARHFPESAEDDDDAPVIGGGGPLPPEIRRMRSRIAGSRASWITHLLTNTSAPLSEAMSR